MPIPIAQPALDLNAMTRIAKDLLAAHAYTREGLAYKLMCTEEFTEEILAALAAQTDIVYSAGLVSLLKPQVGKLSLDALGGGFRRIGLVADTHLACREERLAELHLQYDLFEREGVTTVFHAGNIVDGFVAKINAASVITPTPDGQIQYVIDHYPARTGITTYYITGDDHEGWWIKAGHNWGRDLERTAITQGRLDLKYLGHMEADVELKSAGGSSICKIQHPGEGSAYARSYKAQKIIESFEGGEKPAILILGHYHISNYMQDRNVHVINLPGFQDQTWFARKKRLRMEVGGAIMEFTQDGAGAIARFRVEFNRYFNRGYYKAYLNSDVKCIAGHLVVKGA